MRDGPICRCPECKKGNIYQLDTELYTCTACHKTWTLEEFYPLLWFSQLMRLARRRQREKIRGFREPTADTIEMDIQFTLDRIEELEMLICDLEETLAIAEYAHKDFKIEDLEKALEIKQHRLMLTKRSLQKLYRKRDELINSNNDPTQ